MMLHDAIRECWQGHDPPNDDEICAAVERYREECEGRFAGDMGRYTIGRRSNYLSGLVHVVSTHGRDCYAHLFKRKPKC